MVLETVEAWDLCGKRPLQEGERCRVVGGKVEYESADPVFGRLHDTVILQHFRFVGNVLAGSVKRRVEADTLMEIIPATPAATHSPAR